MAGVYPKYRRLPKVEWAQDTLEVPSGFGTMRAVDPVNALNVRREYFSYPFSFMGLTTGASQIASIPIANDGDFWLSSIANDTFKRSNKFRVQAFDAAFQLVDTLNGYQFFVPNIQQAALSFSADLVNGSNATFLTDIIEPYCVLRGGCLQASIQMAPIGTGETYDMFWVLHGWKEYANAAK